MERVFQTYNSSESSKILRNEGSSTCLLCHYSYIVENNVILIGNLIVLRAYVYVGFFYTYSPHVLSELFEDDSSDIFSVNYEFFVEQYPVFNYKTLKQWYCMYRCGSVI